MENFRTSRTTKAGTSYQADIEEQAGNSGRPRVSVQRRENWGKESLSTRNAHGGGKKKRRTRQKKTGGGGNSSLGAFSFLPTVLEKGTCVHLSRLPLLDVPAPALLGKPGGGNDSREYGYGHGNQHRKPFTRRNSLSHKKKQGLVYALALCQA